MNSFILWLQYRNSRVVQLFGNYLLLCLWWCYSLLNLILASIVILVYYCLSWALCIRLLIHSVLISVWTPSNHLHLDLQIFHFLSSLAFKIFFGNLKSSILTMWSSHSNLPVWISNIILGSLYKFCGSKLVLICQTPFSYMRPYFPFPSHGDRSSSVINCPNFAVVCDNWFDECFMSTVPSVFYETTEPKYLKLETSSQDCSCSKILFTL